MGTIIKATSMEIGNGNDSSVDLGSRVVRECIEKSGIDKRKIVLLINIGIIRENNIVEPANAALIQKKARLNLAPTTKQIELGKGTFSFDIMNGACGFLSATQIIDSLFKNGAHDNAIIVSCDVHPSGRKVNDFPFTHSAAAMLLERSNDKQGFTKILYKTSKDAYLGSEQYFEAEGTNIRKSITIKIADDYSMRLKEFILTAIKEFDDNGELNLQNIDSIIASTPSKTFGREIADALGYTNNTLVETYNVYGDTYTSSQIIGYHIAFENGTLKEGKKVFFIGGGSGLSCTLGMYIV